MTDSNIEIGQSRSVRRIGKDKFLPGTVSIYVGAPEYDTTPRWLWCMCFDADGELIGEAVFCKTYIEYESNPA